MISSLWTRRDWLQRTGQTTAAMAVMPHLFARRATSQRTADIRAIVQASTLDPTPLQAMAQRAVEVAQAAGASYADARLTRTVVHTYQFAGLTLWHDTEEVGLGVRALVNGYWGFAAAPLWLTEDDPDAVVAIARDAVNQGRENAKGPPRTVDVTPISAITGTWQTPVIIDPFAVPIEEKRDAMFYWEQCAKEAGVRLKSLESWMTFARQERILATSGGSLVTQTIYESGAQIVFDDGRTVNSPTVAASGLNPAGRGWELFLDAKLPDQITTMPRQLDALKLQVAETKPIPLGRYTVVCDGDTMASLLDKTFGVATQLDRALGYEANARGTSFLDDPLGMVGNLKVASPLVTVTTNRSAPGQLATVQWDDEGIIPESATLINDGVLTDFQTTREQAGWLAPYYQRQGRPVHSNGCAAAQDGLSMTMQHIPNLALRPNRAALRLEDLVSDVKAGILIEHGSAWDIDFQARRGLLSGEMRKITNGRLAQPLSGGAVLFDSHDIWSHLVALGGASTMGGTDPSHYMSDWDTDTKGQPPQSTSHSTRAVAATIPNQPIINVGRKA